MRLKDESKKEAIFDAAIELINSTGFAETSMSKIAKKANVSPATIYVYFENKEDLLNKMYIMVKHKLSIGLMDGIRENMPIKDRFRRLWKNMFFSFIDNPQYFRFIEQFSNSPLIKKVSIEEAHIQYHSLYDLYEIGRNEKIIKEYPVQLISYFSFMPIINIAKDHLNGDFNMSEELIETAVELAWDAITI
ncbi:TetR/AcrR family transcriptional regulator [Bacteroidota bacterium]